MTIDWAAQEIGIAVGIAIGFIGTLFLKWLLKRKSKHDLHSIKKLVYETGMSQKVAYEGIKELEKLFKEMESAN